MKEDLRNLRRKIRKLEETDEPNDFKNIKNIKEHCEETTATFSVKIDIDTNNDDEIKKVSHTSQMTILPGVMF